MTKHREEWYLRDIDQRQRNIVFPETVVNEGRFWRNLYTGRQKLTPVQIVGVGILAFCVVVLVALVFVPPNGRFSLGHFLAVLTDWIIAFVILGGFLIAFRVAEVLSRRKK